MYQNVFLLDEPDRPSRPRHAFAPRKPPMSPAELEDALDGDGQPLRFDDAPDDLPDDIRQVIAVALGCIALAFGLHPSCRRRACRRGCAAGCRMCTAEFPPATLRIVRAIFFFAAAAPEADLLALRDRYLPSLDAMEDAKAPL
jgi:hypothetical protein